MKEKIYDARTGMEYVLVGDYYFRYGQCVHGYS